MVYTATRAAAMAGWWLCGGRVLLLCVVGGAVLFFVLCACGSCWGLLSGGRRRFSSFEVAGVPSPPLRWWFALSSGGQDTRGCPRDHEEAHIHPGCPRHREQHRRTALGKMEQDLCVQCLIL